MANLFDRRLLAKNAQKILSSQDNYTGVDIRTFRVEKSARPVFYLTITAITGSTELIIENSGDPDQDFKTLFTQTYTAVGKYTIPLTDVQRYFTITLTTSGGTASYTLASILAEASTSNIAEDYLAEIAANTSGNLLGEGKNYYSTALAVPSGGSVDVVTHTVPIGKTLSVLRAEFSGNNIANYELKINGIVVAKKRTWFGTDISGSMVFDGVGLKAIAGDIVKLTVENFRPDIGDFEARIFGVERDE